MSFLVNVMTVQETQYPIDEILRQAFEVFEQAKEIPGLMEAFPAGQSFFENIHDRLGSDKLKIAVTGVIKSGKSTFVNAFLGRELVKRGAGVVTSVTTRIIKGKKNQAVISFKSANEVNAGLKKFILPGLGEAVGEKLPDDFDIRRQGDRAALERFYRKISQALPQETKPHYAEIHAITHALQGYEAVKNMLETEETLLFFESRQFDKYKDLANQPDTAFYIKDICLFAPLKNLAHDIEIADCQGADSTDPSQLSKVLAYLEFSNFIIYCVSSRIGLRESDLAFLKQIKELGVLDHVLIINNCDLTEHESLEDLKKIEAQIRKDLAMLGIDPEIFSFSLLYAHFLNLLPKISKKDRIRFDSWENEKEMLEYCEKNRQAFNACFKLKIQEDRSKLLVSNCIKRLLVILSDLNHRAGLLLELLSSDTQREESARKAVSEYYQNTCRIESMMSASFEKAIQGLKKETDDFIRDIFVKDKEAILSDLYDYVQLLAIDVKSFLPHEKTTGITAALFFIFAEFQRRIDLYQIEAVNPVIKKTVSLCEEKIGLFFKSLYETYHIHMIPSSGLYGPASPAATLSKDLQNLSSGLTQLDQIKRIMGFQLPTKVFEARYHPGIRTKAFADFAVKAVSHLLSLFHDRHGLFSVDLPLKKAGEKIKKENLKIFKKQFEAYGTNLKMNYFLPLIDAAARDFKIKTEERFHQFRALHQKADNIFYMRQSEKQDKKACVLSLKDKIDSLLNSLSRYLSSK